MHVQIKKSQESRFDSDCTYGSHRCWIYIYMTMQSAWCTVKPNVTKYFSDLRTIDDKCPRFTVLYTKHHDITEIFVLHSVVVWH